MARPASLSDSCEVVSLSRPTRRITSLILAALLTLGCATPAFGDQLADKKAQAAAVQAQIASLDTKAEVATERYNAANVRLAKVTRQARAAERRIVVLKSRTKTLQTALDARAAQMYRDPLGLLEVLFGAKTFDDFNTVLALLTNISSRDANTVAQLKQAREQADAARAALLADQADAARQQTTIAASAKQVRSQLTARQQVLAGINSDVKSIIAQQQAAEAAAAQAWYLAMAAQQRAAAAAVQRAADSQPAVSPTRTRSRSGGGGKSAPSGGGGSSSSGGRHSGSGGSGGSGGVPSSGSRGVRAVAWAEKELGKPYEWAASGPDSFDCSGLTMWAYAHVGVSLPHSSADQIGCGSRVSRSSLQSGDLVFFGSPIHHVGMYVGGGDFIEAPHTGAVVRISALDNRSDYAGACRP